MLLFYTPRFSDFFRGYRKATPDCNGLSEFFCAVSTNCSNVSYQGSPAYLDFSLTYLFEGILYNQKNDVLYNVELPHEDH